MAPLKPAMCKTSYNFGLPGGALSPPEHTSLASNIATSNNPCASSSGRANAIPDPTITMPEYVGRASSS
ncbi:hypothetical protein ARMSODRAFT_966431 [Armillaria solidipes]|uniref:Uncharacterized protein n=1 Tax=Armillaria solidipes TaxID=1076256 RepID=A0A2H3AME8_9AGAR|nr:hypothetical protein ARMSODRAFT_966431 [Armillaria solidipes]